MLSTVLVIFMILLYTCQSLFGKLFNDNYPGKSEMSSPVYTVATGLFVALTSYAIAGFSFNLSWQVILLGVFNGIILLAYDFALLGASKYGPYSVLTVFNVAGGIIIPSMFSWLMFDTEFKYVQAICVVAILISVYLISIKGGESYTNKFKFFLWCFILCIANGLYGTVLKFHQFYSDKGLFPGEEKGLVAITFLLAAIFSMIIMFKKGGPSSVKAFKVQNKKSLLFLIISCLICTTAINLYMFIVPYVNYSMLCTYDNAGVFMLSFLSSVVFFKEKIQWKNILGCIIVCISLICISIF